MRQHPSPFSYQDKLVPSDGQIGWFELAFETDRDHWYTFNVYEDGRIVPDINNTTEEHRLLFYRWLQDPTLFMVRYSRWDDKSTHKEIALWHGHHLGGKL